MENDTLVVFSSDHGEMLGNHQQLLKGPQLYDDLTRVPLILRWPTRIEADTVVDQLVQWIDLPATLLDATRCAIAQGVQGHSLLPLMAGQDADWRSWALSEYRDSGFTTDPKIMTTMLRHEHWKLVIWHGKPACNSHRDGELYNLVDDPEELNNLFHDPSHAAQCRQMKSLLLEVMAQAEDRTEPRARPW